MVRALSPKDLLKMGKVKLFVYGMGCQDKCASKIEKELLALPSVQVNTIISWRVL